MCTESSKPTMVQHANELIMVQYATRLYCSFSDNYGVWMSTSHRRCTCNLPLVDDTIHTHTRDSQNAIGLKIIYAKETTRGPIYKKESIVIITMF